MRVLPQTCRSSLYSKPYMGARRTGPFKGSMLGVASGHMEAAVDAGRAATLRAGQGQ